MGLRLVKTASQHSYIVNIILTHLQVGGDGSEEVDNVLVVAEVAHDLQLRHQGLEQVLASIGVESLHCYQALTLATFYTWE